MRKNSIINCGELTPTEVKELHRWDSRIHYASIELIGSHGGRMTVEELYHLVLPNTSDSTHT